MYGKQKPMKTGKWTEEEVTNLKRHFHYYLTNLKLPSMNMCEKFQEVYPDCCRTPKDVYAKIKTVIQQAITMQEQL